MTGTSECTECKCTTKTIAPTWTVTTPYPYLWQLVGAPDGSVYLLVGRAPWIVHYAASDGAEIPFSSRSSLDWARDLVIGNDGSVYVGGDGTFGGDQKTVQVQRLDANGELLSSARWVPGSIDAKFVGMAAAADGSVHVALYTNAVTVSRVDGDQLVDVLGPLQLGDLGFDGNDDIYLEDADLLAFGGEGKLVIGAGSPTYSSRSWLGFIIDGDATGRLIDSGESGGYLGGLVPDGVGGWYWSHGAGGVSIGGIAHFELQFVRASANGEPQWSKKFKRKPTMPGSVGGWQGNFIVGLEDSVVLGVTTTDGLEGAAELSAVSRFGRDGAILNTVSFDGASLAARTGSRSVVLARPSEDAMSGELAYVTFPSAVIEQHPDGDACTNAEACSGGLCCLDAVAGSGVCASEGCAAGARCSDSIACVDSDCLISAGAAEGYCAPTCGASKDCPEQQFCADGHCHASCSNDDDCPYPGTECVDAMNAESVLVSVCAEAPPAP